MNATPHLLPHHARELFEGSGIDPAVAVARGYRSVTAGECRALGFAPSQCRDGRLDPQWTLAGVQVGHKLKPDHPRTDDKGREVKYEHPAGAGHDFDIHPGARHVLRDPATTLYFTEGNKKADAAWSRGVPTVSICGVFMFLHGRLVVPDLDEILLPDRLVRVVFDSDVTRKPAVAEALLRFCAALRRRGARVEVVYLPEGPNGEKTGLDDFFVRGGTPEELDRFARPWTGEGPGIWLRGADETDADDLRRQRDRARDDASTLVRAIMNPDVSRQELVAAVSIAAQAVAKQDRGETEADGAVILSSADIADDWRPAPAPGERVAPTNPSGSRPRLARGRVKPIVADAIARGLLAAHPHPVRRRHANGSTYIDTAWRIDPIESIAAALTPWASHRPEDPSPRKPRATPAPCPECGETHPILRRDACTGCGAVRAEMTTQVGASDKLSKARPGGESTPPDPYVLLSDKLSKAPPAPASTPAPRVADRTPPGRPPPAPSGGGNVRPLFASERDGPRPPPAGGPGDDRWTW